MGRATRWTTLALVALAASLARADEPRVALYYGLEGPFAELLAAELGLVGFELERGPPAAPDDADEALALLRETGAAALLDHHRGAMTIWLPEPSGARRVVVPVRDDPGIAPLVIAETLRAAPGAPAQSRPEPVAPADWAPPPPRIASEVSSPPRVAPEASSPRAAPAPRVTLGAGPLLLHGGRVRGGLAFEGLVRLHPALSVGGLALLAGSPAGAALVRVDGRLGPLRLSLDAGPAVWWRPRPTNDGMVTLRAAPSWTAGLGVTMDLGERWALRGRAGLVRAGPRHRTGAHDAALTVSLALTLRL